MVRVGGEVDGGVDVVTLAGVICASDEEFEFTV